jgi:excisionase family DNA binding protein
MKSIIILTEESLEGILKGQKEIIAKINELQGLKRDTEYLTTQEFMQRVKIGRSKFDQLLAENEINYVRKGRKIYILSSEVDRYFGI